MAHDWRAMYKTPGELAAAVQRYFDEHDGRLDRPTMKELSHSLGFKNGGQLDHQKYRGAGFAKVVQAARQRLTEQKEAWMDAKLGYSDGAITRGAGER